MINTMKIDIDAIRDEVQSIANDLGTHNDKIHQRMLLVDEKMLKEMALIEEKGDKYHHE